MSEPACRRPAAWLLVLAFAFIYLSWGTTYLAIKVGVEHLPPALFGGVRILSAGLILLAYLALRGQSLRISRPDLLCCLAVGGLMFVGGNGLITVGEQYVASGIASVLVATTPLWIALADLCWPGGERLTVRGWVGLLLGLGGVLVLLAPRLQAPGDLLRDLGPPLVVGSSICWAIGSIVLRHRRLEASHLAAAAYQMVLGGGTLTLLGVLAGEPARLAPEHFTPDAVFAFFYLLFVGSLVGYVTYNWLLAHVSAALVGTYAYVNPVVAILVGWLLAGEPITGWTLGGMVVILAGVALVRGGTGGGSEVEEEPESAPLAVAAERAE